MNFIQSLFEKSKSKIFRKFLIRFLLIGLGPMILISIISIYLTSKIILDETKLTLNLLLQERTQRVDTYINLLKRGAQSIAANPRLKFIFNDLVKKFETGKNTSEYSAAYNTYYKELNYFAEGHGCHSLFLIDKKGDIVAKTKNEPDNGQNLFSGKLSKTKLSEAVRELLKKPSMIITPFEYYEPSKKNAIFIVVPITEGNTTIGAVVMQLENSVIDELTSGLNGIGKTGEIILATNDGDSVLFVSNLRNEKNNTFIKTFKMSVIIGKPMFEAINGRSGAGFMKDYRNVDILAAWGYVPELNWGIVVKKDMSEIMQSVYMLTGIFSLICLLLFFVIVIVAFKKSEIVAKPLLEIVNVIRKVTEDDYIARVDISAADEIQELGLKLSESITNLARSNADLEQFAYVTSHDLQEPLRAVSGYVQLLEKKCGNKLGEEAGIYIKSTIAATERMKVLINDLLDFSRVTNTKKPFSAVDMNEVYKEVLSGLQKNIKEKGVAVIKKNLPVVSADETQMIRLLQNLIANAIKFSRKENPEIHIGSKEEKDGWLIWVKDNGIGIESQYFEKIFVIFQRLNNRDDYPGTGIGLAICKKIVESYGGRIWVESEFEKGTAFYFTIKGAVK